jgi:hypothetical protein
VDEAELVAQHLLSNKYLVIQMKSAMNQLLSALNIAVDIGSTSLAEIFRFDSMIREIQRHNPGHKLVLCTGHNEYLQAKAVFLSGCHLIMTEDFTYQEAVSLFSQMEGLKHMFSSEERSETTIHHRWAAIHKAKCLNWVDFGDVFDVGMDDGTRIFIEEYIHYSRCASCVLNIF